MFTIDPPRFLARTPHGYHDVSVIRDELQAAGFLDIRIETRADVSRAPSPNHPAFAYCRGTPLRNEIEARNGADGLQSATDHAAAAIESRYGAGEVSAKIQAHGVTAVR